MWNKDITDVSIVMVLILTNLYYLHVVQYINAYTTPIRYNIVHFYFKTYFINNYFIECSTSNGRLLRSAISILLLLLFLNCSYCSLCNRLNKTFNKQKKKLFYNIGKRVNL